MTDPPRVLVVMALEAEGQGVFEQAGVPVLYSGVGKVNAAIALARKLASYRHQGHAFPLVVNFGSAGSRSFDTGALVACSTFAQRDMDVRALGFSRGVTPFESWPARIEFPPVFTDLQSGLCGSGDSFATGGVELDCDVIDMEAYAFAKVCLIEGAQFACAKYITDGADHTAATDWQSNVHRAADAFLRLYRQLPAGASASSRSQSPDAKPNIG